MGLRWRHGTAGCWNTECKGLEAHPLARLVCMPDAPRMPTAVCLRCGALGIKHPRALMHECRQRPSGEGARVLAGLAERNGKVPRYPGILFQVQCVRGLQGAA